MSLNPALLPNIVTRTFVKNINGGSINESLGQSLANYDYVEISQWYSSQCFSVMTIPVLYVYSMSTFGVTLANGYHPTITANIIFNDISHVSVNNNASDSTIRIVGIKIKQSLEQ